MMFTNRFTKSIAGTLLTAGTLGIAAIVGAGAANADAVDDTFVASLAQAGIPANSSLANNPLSKVEQLVLDDTANGQQTSFVVLMSEQADVSKATHVEHVFRILDSVPGPQEPGGVIT